MLTRQTYIGRHEFNRRTKNGDNKPDEEVIPVAVPPIIDQAVFDAVQARMKARNPKVTPPQVVGGPTLLTGLIHCAKCGGAMTIRTGKGGRYRYYACSTKARQGPTACTGMTVPMEKLDDLVARHLEDRLLDPARLESVLATVLDRRQERTERRRDHIAELNLLVRAAERGDNIGSIASTLIRLLERFGAGELQAAITDALERGVPHPNAVSLALERRREDRRQAPPVAIILPAHVLARDAVVQPHALDSYDRLTESNHEEP